MGTMRWWGAGAVGVLLLAGCGGERPKNIPRPTPGLFSIFQQGCPDLRGTYSMRQADGSRQRFLGIAMKQALDRAPRYHSVWRIDSIDEKEMVVSTHATKADLREAFEQWRNAETYSYALWSQSLRPSRQGGGILLVRQDTSALAAPRQFLKPYTSTTISGLHYTCASGWVTFVGEEEPDADNSERGQVKMTRAADGGLVAFSKFRYTQSLSLWCGDGCRPDIPLPDAHEQLWRHWVATEAQDVKHIDWQAWANDDDRPQEVRHRYREGTFLAYATPEEINPGYKVADSQVIEDIPVPPSHPETLAASNSCNNEERAQQHLTDGIQAQTACRGGQCMMEGQALSAQQVSQTLRALDQAQLPEVELDIIERIDERTMRFRIRFADRCS